MRRIGFAALWAVATLTAGCDVASCDTEPFGDLPVAAIHLPPTGPAGEAVAACTRLVSYDGRDYRLDSQFGSWNVPEESVNEIGLADGGNAAAGEIDDRRVYALDDVDPADAIAMRIGPGGDLTVLVHADLLDRDVACQYLDPPVRSETCADTD